MNRRAFLRSGLGGLAVIATPLAELAAPQEPGLSSAGAVFSPFPSLRAALNSKCSAFFGIKMEERLENLGNGKTGTRLKRVPRDPNTLYTADGVSGEEEPHSFFLTFEVTNNRILCSTSSTGLLQAPCIFSRLVPSQRRGSWFQAEELLCGSPWGFGLRLKGDQAVRLPMTHGSTVELLATVFPLFGYRHDPVHVRLLVFAPQSGGPRGMNPRALVAVAQVWNRGAAPWEGSLLAPNLRDLSEVNPANGLATPDQSPHPRFTEHPAPIKPGYEAIICLDDAVWNPGCPEVSMRLEPGQDRIFSFGLLLGQSPDELRRLGPELRQRTALDWLNETARLRAERYGFLSIPADPYYTENYIRLVEEGSSALLYASDGRPFAGGPSGAADFAMTLFDPDSLLPVVLSESGFQPRPKGQPAWDGLSYSLVNSVANLCLMGLYHRMTGDRATFQGHPGLLAYARERLADVLATRQGEPCLFPAKMIWDGPARGDYHTGSNIMAWLAFHGMAHLARHAYGEPTLADHWSATADQIKRAIYRHCVGDSRLGRRFFEGANADGTFVPGHDSEEAFTTLAPFFGFCEADDPALVNHAKLAFTTDNPLYEPAVDGIWWEARGTTWAGTSMPGQMAMLAAITSEKDQQARLEQFRGLTDVDGSVWWWPYLYPCSDRLKVRRRDWPSDCSKCGYAAALYLCQFVNNLLGLHLDVPAGRVALRPFTPWPRFRWERSRLGRAMFDFCFQQDPGQMTGSIVNRNRQPYEGLIELTLPVGAGPITRKPLEASNSVRFNRPAVRMSSLIKPGETMTMEIAYGP